MSCLSMTKQYGPKNYIQTCNGSTGENYMHIIHNLHRENLHRSSNTLNTLFFPNTEKLIHSVDNIESQNIYDFDGYTRRYCTS